MRHHAYGSSAVIHPEHPATRARRPGAQRPGPVSSPGPSGRRVGPLAMEGPCRSLIDFAAAGYVVSLPLSDRPAHGGTASPPVVEGLPHPVANSHPAAAGTPHRRGRGLGKHSQNRQISGAVLVGSRSVGFPITRLSAPLAALCNPIRRSEDGFRRQRFGRALRVSSLPGTAHQVRPGDELPGMRVGLPHRQRDRGPESGA